MRAQPVPVFLLILLQVSTAPVAAQLVPLPGPERANTRSAGVQDRPVVAAGPGGGFVVVWVSAGVGGPTVVGQPFAAGGSRAGSELEIADDLADGAVPGLAIGRDGSFTVVWRSADEALEGRRYDHRGEPLTGVFRVTGGEERPRHPALAATIGGEVVAVWEVGPGAGVVGQRLAADGRRPEPSFRIHQRRGRHARPVAGSGDDGSFVVAWQGDDGSGYGVFGRRFDRRAAPLGDEQQLNVYTADDQRRPALAIAADGGFAVVWESTFQDGTARSIVGRRFDRRGRSAGGEVEIQRQAGVQRRPALALDPDGSALVAWEDLGTDPRGDVRGQWIGRDGSLLGPALRIDGTPGPPLAPSLAATGIGSFTAVWTADAGGGASDIGLRRYASPRLELAGGRFVVEVEWKDFAQRSGRGVAVPHRANTGHFWFFRPQDLDLTVKVVDGRAMNGHFWLYYGATSNVAFTLRISDRVTGRTKTCFGPAGRFVSVGDVLAFPAPQG